MAIAHDLAMCSPLYDTSYDERRLPAVGLASQQRIGCAPARQAAHAAKLSSYRASPGEHVKSAAGSVCCAHQSFSGTSSSRGEEKPSPPVTHAPSNCRRMGSARRR